MTTMSSSELAGQSMLLRFDGPVVTDDARDAFRAIRPAGVILFGDNIASREQIHALVREVQDEARSLGMPPLLIAVDQEGGLVSRFSPDMVTTPGPMALTALGDPAVTERCTAITGRQLREVGITVDFAPVVDVNNNPANPVIRTRSFGDTVERVVDGALATIRGLESTRVAATIKHFPGHGDTSVDSHLGLPVIPHSLDRLHAIELVPFRAAVDAGVAGVMTTHIVFPVLDEHPATLSRPILTDLLRHEIGFDGVIFTDSLSMDAIDDRYGLADCAVRCKAAGVDVLEANESLANQRTRHAAMVDAIDDGSLERGIFERTGERVDALRVRYGIDGTVPDLRPVDPSLRDEVRAIAGRTIALANGTWTPIGTDERAVVLDFQRLRSSEAEDPFNRAGTIRDEIAIALPQTKVVTMQASPSSDEIAQAVSATRDASTIVVLTRDAREFTYQIEIARSCIAAAPSARIVHVALRGPYDAELLGAVDATLLTFGDPPLTLVALVDVLTGHAAPTASMPVALG